jgi:hypothetical protein
LFTPAFGTINILEGSLGEVLGLIGWLGDVEKLFWKAPAL